MIISLKFYVCILPLPISLRGDRIVACLPFPPVAEPSSFLELKGDFPATDVLPKDCRIFEDCLLERTECFP